MTLQYLSVTVDKFTFRVAADRFYTPEGIWLLPCQGTGLVRVGLADYPQQHNGDIAFAKVKPAGTKVRAGESIAEMETIKAMVELHLPVSGTIAKINPALDAVPEIINQSPYEEGWLADIEAADWETERSQLLEAPAYFTRMQGQIQEEMKNK